jgi:penicillin-binding protein 1A
MKLLKILFKFLLFFLLAAGCLGLAGGAYLYLRLSPELPSIELLKDVRLQVPLRIYTHDSKLLAEYGEKRRIPLAYKEIPHTIRDAFLAAEDARFFEHPGVDYQGLLRAAGQLMLTGQRRQGGSTITMQVARNFFLSREKTYTRKLKEILLSLRIEQELSKEEILELYLNKIYLGNRAYGIGAAAQVYYGRAVGELELPQIAMIAGLPKAPSTTNPLANPQRALQRRDYVLERMRQLDFITESQYQQAKAASMSASLHRAAVELSAPYVAEMVRAEMVGRYGEDAYTRGLVIHTTLDSRLQSAAQRALRGALQGYDKRHGYRGVAGHRELQSDQGREHWRDWLAQLPPVAGLVGALVLEAKDKAARLLLQDGSEVVLDWAGLAWARVYKSVHWQGPALKQATDVLTPGDLVYLYQDLQEDAGKEPRHYWRLAQIPAVEGALVSLNPNDGAIQALVGGNDYYRSKFNRVTQAKRQPGSGFKAVIYSAALEFGYTPASLINDAPLVVQDASLEGDWRPENYSGKWFGPTRLRVALYKSRNLVSIRLLRNMGVDFALRHAQRFGFDDNSLPRNLSLALGSGEVTPLQMARAYAVLANGGYRVEPYFIDRIEDVHDGVLFQAKPWTVCSSCPDILLYQQADDGALTLAEGPFEHAPRVLSAQNQYIMTSMMKDVIQLGTARKARALGRSDLAGKTGTTNDQRDGWFNGFNRDVVTIAWVGFDSYQPLGRGEVGGKVALPAWMDYMKVALEGMPERAWDLPPDIVSVRIDPQTGERAASGDEKAVFELFRKGAEPLPGARSGASEQLSGSGQRSETLTEELF